MHCKLRLERDKKYAIFLQHLLLLYKKFYGLLIYHYQLAAELEK